MVTRRSLDILGHQGQPVPNGFVAQDDVATGLAVFLPGLGYTCDMPLFYYAENLLLQRRYDLLRVEYRYGDAFQSGSPAEQENWLLADVAAAIEAALSQRSYDRVAIVGKSLGTLAMALLARDGLLPATWTTVWLTPLTKIPFVGEAISQRTGPTMVAIGDRDPHYDLPQMDRLTADHGVSVLTVDGGDHGLELPGDAVGSAVVMSEIVQNLEEFVAFAETAG